MTKWKRALDAIVSGNAVSQMMPPHIDFLSFPSITTWREKHITIDWEATEEVYQGGGMVFGGYLSALADYAAGTAMLTLIEDNDHFVTRKLDIEYKQPVRAGLVTIQADVTTQNDKHHDVIVTFTNTKGEVCAVANVYQTVLQM